MAFSFVTVDDVEPFLKGVSSDQRKKLITAYAENISARLCGWYPTLKGRWDADEADSPLRVFVTAMVTEAVRRRVNNPDGFSAETIGPFAYSKFDSEDSFKNLFLARDLTALEAMLAPDTNMVRSAKTDTSGLMFTTNLMDKWPKYQRRWYGF